MLDAFFSHTEIMFDENAVFQGMDDIDLDLFLSANLPSLTDMYLRQQRKTVENEHVEECDKIAHAEVMAFLINQ